MASWRRALTFGFLIWLIPFVVSFTLASLKESWRSLFESIMAVTVSAVVAMFAVLYFHRTGNRTLREGASLGTLWLAISVLIDLPLMLSPPLSYSPVEYAADVGLTYLMMPVITLGIAVAAGLGPRAPDSTIPPTG